MSDKGLLFKKRKNNHGSHHKCSKGSGFPRHSMNHYPGTHLGMKLRYSKPSVGRLYCEWGPNRGYLRTNRITGFINKFIGKPYNDLVKAFYALIKDLRDSHKEVGLSDLEWHFEQFRYRRWGGDYYVDDDGLVQVVHPETVRKQTSHINKQQVAYNKKVKIPDFGRVSLPRTPGRETNNRYCLPEYGSVSYEKPQYDAPKFLGNYWCDMDGKMLFLPVYHVPGTNMYAKYWADSHNIPKPKKYKESYYYSSYPQRWDRKGYCDRFSDMFRPGDSAFKWAQGVENGWVVPIIPFSKRSEWYGLRYAMYKRMYHSRLILMPNTKELTNVRELVQRCREHLSQCENPENWWYGKTERCQKELDEALEKLRKTPNMAYFEVGYGQLYPMVKRYDYEKALRICEQEQKETSMEGQE